MHSIQIVRDDFQPFSGVDLKQIDKDSLNPPPPTPITDESPSSD